jgi:RNA polymerase sigma-70 factor (ECF subfamily)
VDANTGQLADLSVSRSTFDFGAVFRSEYKRMTGVISRIIGDPARAEELAVEVFCRLWRRPNVQGPKAGGWLHRAAIRLALDELRRRSRREKYEALFSVFRPQSTPEQIHLLTEKQRQVRATLSRLNRRDAELLLLRNDGLSYHEIAEVLDLNPASVGTLLSRAQKAFRQRYLKLYGQQD